MYPRCTNINSGMFGTLIGLFFFHRRQRDDEREKRLQYWREQVRSFRRDCSVPADLIAECIPTKYHEHETKRSR